MVEDKLEQIKQKCLFSTGLFEGTPCWYWKSYTHRQEYSTVRFEGKQYSLHRLTFELASGDEIPPGMVVDHKCNNKPCGNPAHLELVEHGENIRRAFVRKPRVKKKDTRVQVTLTMEENDKSTLEALADKYFEGNVSMAFRYVMKHHTA